MKSVALPNEPTAAGPTHPARAAARALGLLLALVLAASGCRAIRPTNAGDWSPDQAILSRADIQGDRITIHNIRNCEYRTTDDYTVRYYDKTFDLRQLRSVDFIMVPFPEMPSLAHTMLSFGFEDRDYLAVSVEIRKHKGETYDPVKGLVPHFALMYVLGDERDLIGLRANHRLNDVYLYHGKATPDQARRLFVDVMERVNKLYDQPEFYNTLTNNCTTNLARHINDVSPRRVRYDYRVLLPGYSDRLAYDLGLIDTALPFAQAREQARVNKVAYVYRDSPAFSVNIRR